MKKIIILFGEIGSGKTYCGKNLSVALDIPFFDGDTVATPEMIECIKKFRFFTPEIINNYIRNHLGPAILKRAANDLIVAQALYMNKHRSYLKELLLLHGYSVEFRWVQTSFFQNLYQLWNRTNGFRWIIYWLMNKPFFEKPTYDYSSNGFRWIRIDNE